MPFLAPVGAAIMSGVSAAAGAIGAAGTAATAATGLSGTTLLSLAGTGLGMFSSVIGGIQQKSMYDASAKAASYEAKAAMRESQETARRRREGADELASSQIATLGASGIDIMGSPLDIIIKDRARGELHAQDALYSGKSAATGKRYEATLAKYQGRSSMANAMLSVGGQAIGAGKTILGSLPKSNLNLLDSYDDDYNWVK